MPFLEPRDPEEAKCHIELALIGAILSASLFGALLGCAA